MSFPRYPEYKDSGYESVGAIPAEWTPTRLRFLLQDGYAGLKIGPFGSQLTSDMLVDSGPFKVYGQENVIANDFIRGSRYIDGSKFQELSVYEVDEGDLLITMMGTSGRCHVVPINAAFGIMDSHLLRMRVTQAVNAKFIRLLIDEADYVGMQIELAGKGSIMHGLNSSIVKNLLLFVPSTNEQNQILAFLDRETAKIDELMAEQRRLMELLKEKRQAVISHAVTRGLNPHVPLKPSGIKWLGVVPEHWEVIALKRLIARGTSISYGIVQPGTPLEEGVPFVQTTNMTKGSFDLENLQKTTAEIAAQFPRSQLDGGEVILGIRASIGAAHIVPSFLAGANLSRGVARIVPNQAISSAYLVAYFATGAASQYWQLGKQGSTFNEVSIETVRELTVTVPPIDEQTEITTYLEVELSRFDTLTTEAQRAIDLLQERRTALISAAVTGQIDVRGTVES